MDAMMSRLSRLAKISLCVKSSLCDNLMFIIHLTLDMAKRTKMAHSLSTNGANERIRSTDPQARWTYSVSTMGCHFSRLCKLQGDEGRL